LLGLVKYYIQRVKVAVNVYSSMAFLAQFPGLHESPSYSFEIV